MDEVKYVNIHGTDLPYIERGKGEPMVLVHGSITDYRIWTRQIDSLSRYYRVIAYSRRHHQPNTATFDTREYTYDRHLLDLVGLMNSLRLGPSHLVGHSYGASLAAMVALERPQLVRSLVLCEPNLFSLASRPNDKVSFRIHRIALDLIEKLLSMGEEKLAIREYVNILCGENRFDELSASLQSIINDNARTLAPMLKSLGDSWTIDPQVASRLGVPTLLVSGEDGLSLYRAICNELAELMPNSELLRMQGASPELQMENSLELSRAIIRFLSKRSNPLVGG